MTSVTSPWSVLRSCIFSWRSRPPLHAWVGSWNTRDEIRHGSERMRGSACFCDAPHIESAVQHRRQMLVLHPHAVGADVEQTDRTVPRRHQQELSRARTELHSRDAILRTLGQLELVCSSHLRARTHTHTHTHRDIHTQRERKTQRERETHTHTHTHTQRDMHTQRERERHRERDAHTQRERERDTHRFNWFP